MPTSLPKECAKAAQIFISFSSIIPQEILKDARGFAILTIAKAGFVLSARAGSGVVIAKLANGCEAFLSLLIREIILMTALITAWSAPSAVGTVSGAIVAIQ